MISFSDEKGRCPLLIIAVGAFCLGTAFLAATLLLASCSASVSSELRFDGGARILIRAEVPAALSARLRKLATIGSGEQSGAAASTSPFFDSAAIRASIAARPVLRLVELSQPSADSLRAEISVRSLDELSASPDLKGTGLLTMTRGASWAECRIRIERGNAKALTALVPGIDPELMEALSPPALEEDPVTADEYESMLRSILGEKAALAMEGATITLSLSAPGMVIGSGGGILAGSALTATIPFIQALALERPIELWIRWKQ